MFVIKRVYLLLKIQVKKKEKINNKDTLGLYTWPQRKFLAISLHLQIMDPNLIAFDHYWM